MSQTFDGTSRTPAKLAILEQIGDKVWTLSVHRPAHEPVQFDSSSTPPKWSPDGRFLAYQASGALWLYEEPFHRHKRLVSVPRWSLIDWSPDGKFLFFLAQPRGEGTDTEAMVYEMRTGKSRPLDYGMPRNWSADGKQAFALHIFGNPKRDEDGRYEGERADGAWPTDVVILDSNLRLVRRVTDDGWYDSASWLPRGEILLEQLGTEPADGAGAPTHFSALNLWSGNRRSLDLPWDVEGYSTALSPDGRKLAAIADRAKQRLYIVDLESGRSKSVAQDVSGTALAWTRDGKSLFFDQRTDTDTIQLFKLDVATGKAEQVSHQPESYSHFESDNAHGTVMFSQYRALYQADGRANPVQLVRFVGARLTAVAAWWR